MSLRDGTKKMSKSEELIILDKFKDSSDERKKNKKSKTDTEPITENIQDYENRPEAYNLLSIYSDLSDKKLKPALTNLSEKFSF